MTTVLRVDPGMSEEQDVPRPLRAKLSGSDLVFVLGTRAIAASVLAITGGIGLFLALRAFPTIGHYGISFFTETEWNPDSDVVGILSILLGTFTVASVGIVTAFPLALASALFISEYALAKLKATLVSMVDLMAAVPSIIYGLWGFFLLQPHASAVAHWFHLHLGWLPFFHVEADANAAIWEQSRYTSSAFIAGIVVGMMVMPMAAAVMIQVFGQAPQGEREAAYALGSTKWGMITSSSPHQLPWVVEPRTRWLSLSKPQAASGTSTSCRPLSSACSRARSLRSAVDIFASSRSWLGRLRHVVLASQSFGSDSRTILCQAE